VKEKKKKQKKKKKKEMSNNNHRAEMLKLMEENKMYSLPTSCRCGYKAKNGNWVDMEKHYETCAQFRNIVKMRSVELKQQIQEPVKSIGIQLTEKIVEIISELRDIEKEFKGQGYTELENMKSILSNGSYKVIKHALDNPNKNVKVNINYSIKNG
jgi:hypothetical protein